MIGCLLIILLDAQVFKDKFPTNTIFWSETVALIFFGISWVVKGNALEALNLLKKGGD